MNEADTRANLIDPKLVAAGWGVVEGSKIHREFPITLGRILVGGKRAAPLKADYVLSYRHLKLAAVEAKSDDLEVGEGVGQAKNYAHKLQPTQGSAPTVKKFTRLKWRQVRRDWLRLSLPQMNYGQKSSVVRTIGRTSLMLFLLKV